MNTAQVGEKGQTLCTTPMQCQYLFAGITRERLRVNGRLTARKLRGSIEQPFQRHGPLRVKHWEIREMHTCRGRGEPAAGPPYPQTARASIGKVKVRLVKVVGSAPLLSTSHRISWAANQVPELAPCLDPFNGSLGATGTLSLVCRELEMDCNDVFSLALSLIKEMPT